MVHFFIGASCLTSDKKGRHMPRIRAHLNTPRNACLHSITGGPPALVKRHQLLPKSCSDRFPTCQVRSEFPGSALASPTFIRNCPGTRLAWTRHSEVSHKAFHRGQQERQQWRKACTSKCACPSLYSRSSPKRACYCGMFHTDPEQVRAAPLLCGWL